MQINPWYGYYGDTSTFDTPNIPMFVDNDRWTINTVTVSHLFQQVNTSIQQALFKETFCKLFKQEEKEYKNNTR